MMNRSGVRSFDQQIPVQTDYSTRIRVSICAKEERNGPLSAKRRAFYSSDTVVTKGLITY